MKLLIIRIFFVQMAFIKLFFFKYTDTISANCKPTNNNVFFSKHEKMRLKSQDVIKLRKNIDKYVYYMTD